MKSRLLVENQDEISRPLFRIREDYEAFKQSWREVMTSTLDAQRLARVRSVDAAKYCIVN